MRSGLKINSEELKKIISKVKEGDDELREQVISNYRHFILGCVSKYMNKYIDVENSEEFSIGLIAFNTAIDDFNETKNSNFLNFAELVINRRLINYITVLTHNF